MNKERYKEIMKQFGTKVLSICMKSHVKFIVISVVGGALVGLSEENSIRALIQNSQRISDLTEEIAEYEGRYRNDISQIRELNRNPKAVERIARTRYFMKYEDEDIYVLSDDNREPPSIVSQDEAVE